MEDRSEQYIIPDLKGNQQIISRVAELEQEISQLLNKDVSLIVYLKEANR
ncbi:hypothetical protein [Laceyella putida]|uniref:Uncharacterized protein n=1 Tax=Laceyella putida TaxID=110101 RepID=A0ABW2RL48_9BACL